MYFEYEINGYYYYYSHPQDGLFTVTYNYNENLYSAKFEKSQLRWNVN
jgi:hypothetical protein